MAIDTASLMAFAVLGSMKKAERTRSQTPLILTLVPGPAPTRAAVSTVAVSTQARDAVRREHRVAAAAILSLLPDLAAGTLPAVALLNSPALCDLDAREIEEDTRMLWADYGTPRFGFDMPREGDLWERRRPPGAQATE